LIGAYSLIQPVGGTKVSLPAFPGFQAPKLSAFQAFGLSGFKLPGFSASMEGCLASKTTR
jgi:hypothetical protein